MTRKILKHAGFVARNSWRYLRRTTPCDPHAPACPAVDIVASSTPPGWWLKARDDDASAELVAQEPIGGHGVLWWFGAATDRRGATVDQPDQRGAQARRPPRQSGRQGHPIQSALREQHLDQLAAITAVYAASVRSLVAVLGTLNEQVAALHKEVAPPGPASNTEVERGRPGPIPSTPLSLTRPIGTQPTHTLRAVRSWLTPAIALSRWWKAWSTAPPPPELQAMIDAVTAGHGLYLYTTPLDSTDYR